MPPRDQTPPSPGIGASTMLGFLVGATGMFATMYATQAVLPDIARDLGTSASRAGLTVTVVVVAVAVGGWVWGPVSDRIGRRRTLMIACLALTAPTVATGLAPGFGWLLAFRALQGLCMPGLLTVGVPYVAEVFAPALGGRAMGYYTAALVAGGLIGRVGVGLVAEAASWRIGLSGLAALPLGAAAIMLRTLPEAPTVGATRSRRHAARVHLRNARLLRATAGGSGLYFAFVAVFSYIAFRLQRAPFHLGTGTTSAVFALWVCGAGGPLAGRLGDRHGWRRLTSASIVAALAGCALSLVASLPVVIVGLALITTGMFAGVTGAQIGLGGAVETDRGVASALYFSVYYVSGGIGAYLPGLAWQRWGWEGVTAVSAVALLTALVLMNLPVRRA